MNNETILTLISAGGRAPSGDNMQPWKTTWDGMSLKVYLEYGIDPSMYNINEYGSYLACGAFIENIRVKASSLGYDTSISFFPIQENPLLIAELRFTQGLTDLSNLAPSIDIRCSNRKPYQKKDIPAEIVSDLEKIDPLVRIITDTQKRNAVFAEASLNEYFILHNDHVRNGLFATIRWTAQEEEKNKTGLYVKTLELDPGQLFFFKKFQKPSIASFFRWLGFSKVLRLSGKVLYGTSSAAGLVAMKDLQLETFVRTGMIVERVWLTATKHGLSFQPITGIPYLILAMKQDSTLFSQNEQALLAGANISLREAFELGDSEQFGMIFRLGYAKAAASAVSKKKDPRTFHTFLNT